MDTLDFIMQLEGGNMTFREYIDGMAKMIETGLAWSLQGSIYGRPAKALIEQGTVSADGKEINYPVDIDLDALIYEE